ncbi:MAG: alpha-ketoglutarate-dependent dioxygenase AlkB [Arenimonas sp.]|uniref:alpha-ketoglutarate-dependent dioxygenase AlkB family protein n=1 Tax=Arenimonas sp. TaxID=1872635 RepID=UPI0025C14B01|nr:alpha-ketoglutarate-dependent dioxygenase AlkB [Arenimonas sp.]MBW8367009.1 alpha-ketoglutarate-dependent dioxygenase AlkB [Arenimonas sp.]
MLFPDNLPALADAQLWFEPQWLAVSEADALLEALRGQIAWETHRIKLFGKEHDSPRLSCWIGDPGASYVYSRARFEPRPWPAALAELRPRIDAASGVAMNSVLANLYRSGQDAMGWHSDDEPELGARPMIASLSLGGTRRFRFRHRRDHSRTFAMELPHGSLLLMSGDTQANWQHALPRTARAVPARLNLTFRRIQAVSPSASP